MKFPFVAAAALLALNLDAAEVPTAARVQLLRYLDSIAHRHLDERARAVAAIADRAGAEKRQAAVRAKILELIGGLPEERGPLAARQTGTLERDGFRVEKIVYDSLPGFHVTANVYVPAQGRGPFPAVLLSPGHGPAGKAGEYGFAANLARNGFLALAWDPIGQGERLQHYDAAKKASTVGGPTGEHSYAGVQTMVTGDHVSRYFIYDTMRAVDYLVSRADVDGARIGAFGCSGGGTATAYLAALDPRIKAAASACYITSFRELLASQTGVQEAEQSIPGFLAAGLDFGDWVELAAPRPYAIVSTTEDMFPFAGAKQTYEEAKRIYALYGAADRLQWITGPGRHGALMPVYPEIIGFFVRWLKGSSGPIDMVRLAPPAPQELWCTTTGQLATSLGGETIYSLNRRRAAALPRSDGDLRAAAALSGAPGGAPPPATVLSSSARDGYRVETLSLRSEDGIDVPATLAVPGRPGAKPAVLMVDAHPHGEEVERLARSGSIVLVLQPRPSPPGIEETKSPLLGTFYLTSLRALLVGKTLVGMRADDIIRAVDWLAVRPDVDRKAISAYGYGPLGVALLHAAVADPRIARVTVEHSLASYRMLAEQSLHRDAPEVALPGVLRHYDLADLVRALAPRPVTVLHPVDAAGEPVAAEPSSGRQR